MRIRVLRNIGPATHPGLPPHREQTVVDEADDVAALFVELGLAEPAAAPERVRAVVPAAERLEAVPPSDEAESDGGGRRKKK